MRVSHKIGRKPHVFASTTNRVLTSGALILVGALGGSVVGSDASGSAVSQFLQILPGSLAPVPLGDTLIGPAASSTPMTMRVTLKPRDPAALAAMAKAVSTPNSPEYHHFLASGQFAQFYGPTPATIAAVTSALKAEGLSVGALSGTDLSLPVTGTVARVESAFATPLVTYRLPSGRVGYDNTRSPSVPTSVASQIQGVLGLDTLSQPKPLDRLLSPGRGTSGKPLARVSALTGQPTPTGSSCVSAIGIDQANYGALDANNLAQAYSFNSLYAHNDYGSGSTVALVELAGSGYSSSDLSTFANCYGITVGPNQITETNVDGGSNTVGGNTVEAELDIETVLSMAPQARIQVYEGNQSIYNVLNQIVSDNTAKIVSISWGACEAGVTPSYQQSENTLLEEASLNGQTVLAAAGDNGSAGCNANGETGSSTGYGPTAQAVDSANGTLYVANGGDNTISVISEASQTVVASVNIGTGTSPNAVLFDAATSELYVANYESHSLTEFSTTDCNSSVTSGCASTTTITAPSYLDGPCALALDGTTLYVTNRITWTVAVFDTTSGQFVGLLTLPFDANPHAIAVDSSHMVYVTDFANGEVDYFNGATCNDVTQSGCSTTPNTIAVGGYPDVVTLDAATNKLFVGGYEGGVSVISTANNTVVTTISTSNVVGLFYGNMGRVSSITMSPNSQDVLANVWTTLGTILATINPTNNTIIGAVNWNATTNLIGQLVSDPTLNLVWTTDFNNSTDAVMDLNLAVNDPASQPEVTAVGGTTLSALGPMPTESAWNGNTNYASGAGGGGISQAFAMPSFQTALGTISGSSGTPCANSSGYCREVPDVSASADPNTGYVVYDSQAGVSGWIGVGGYQRVVTPVGGRVGRYLLGRRSRR